MAETLAHAWIKLTLYVAATGLGLEIAHRIYWRLLRDAAQASLSSIVRLAVMAILPTIPLGVSIGITFIFCTYLDNCPISTLGLVWDRDSAVYLFAGIAISMVCVLIIFALGKTAKLLAPSRSSFWANPKEKLPCFCGCLMDFIVGSVFEEIVMRGYVLTVLFNAYGAPTAVIGSSIIFALFHLIKHPKMPAIFTVNAFVFGVLAAHARLATGALWLPIGLHLGWNVTMEPILGLPCSGKNYENGLLTTKAKAPNWISGGLYSPDAGVLGTAGLLVAIAGLLIIVPR